MSRLANASMRRVALAAVVAAAVLAACGGDDEATQERAVGDPPDVHEPVATEGREIAFERYEEQRRPFRLYAAVYVMRTDGSEQSKLSGSPDKSDEGPAFSPDGRRIAFARSEAREGSFIYLMNADGSEQTKLTDLRGGSPAFSPDGERIAFAAGDGDARGIHVVNADGTGLTRLTDNPVRIYGAPAWDSQPAWSPDGERIAFSRSGARAEIWVMNADGSGQTNLTDGPGFDELNDSPTFSPDGRRIAFLARSLGEETVSVWMMNADGSDPARLIDRPRSPPFRTPAFSPDGERIAFTADSAAPQDAGIYVMNADGSDPTRIQGTGPDDHNPAWSPIAAGSLAAGSERPERSDELSPITVSPERPDEEGSVRISFPTPYAIGDITPGAVRWAELLSARREAKGREPVDPRPVGGGDNYHVILSGPWGPDCEDRQRFAQGHFAEPGEDALTVSIDGMLAGGGPAGGALWCRGRYSGYVEFRQLTVNRGRVPWERLGNFSFVVEPAGGG